MVLPMVKLDTLTKNNSTLLKKTNVSAMRIYRELVSLYTKTNELLDTYALFGVCAKHKVDLIYDGTLSF